MFQNLELFQISHAMSRHAGRRQALVAENMANSDTPNYRPRDLTPFAEVIQSGHQMSRTRAGHMHGEASFSMKVRGDETSAAQSPNGNSVSVEQELLRSVEVKRQHDRALAVYRHSMTVLRASIGRQ